MRRVAWPNSRRKSNHLVRGRRGRRPPRHGIPFPSGLACGSLWTVKQSVQVQIAGQTLAIRSDEGPEYVQALADFVDTQVRELTTGRKTTSPQRVALLAAMQIADELFREKDLHARFRAKVEARLRALEQSLDQHETHLAEM